MSTPPYELNYTKCPGGSYIPTLGEAITFYSCFISYSHADKVFARRLHDQLQGKGIRCWRDEHQVLPGDDIYEQIDRGIRLWDKVLLCCSESSLTGFTPSPDDDQLRDSDQREWERSNEEGWFYIE